MRRRLGRLGGSLVFGMGPTPGEPGAKGGSERARRYWWALGGGWELQWARLLASRAASGTLMFQARPTRPRVRMMR